MMEYFWCVGFFAMLIVALLGLAAHGSLLSKLKLQGDRHAEEKEMLRTDMKLQNGIHAEECRRFRAATDDFIRDREAWNKQRASLEAELESTRKSVQFWKNASHTKTGIEE